MKSSYRVAICVATLAVTTQLRANPLTLESYLKQVTDQHQGLKSSLGASEGAQQRSNESVAMLAPNVFVNAQQLVDEKPTANPAFQGNKTSATSYSVGVSKLTSFGTAAKLSYNSGFVDIDGANPAFFPEPETYETRTTLEVSQPLWRNFFGSETRAVMELSRNSALATSATEAYKARMMRMEAELTYWRLVLARESVAVNKASLQRSEKIRAWSANRAKLELADKADLIQAEAAVAGRNLELRMAGDEEEAAARAFNSLRGVAGTKVSETLTPISPEMVDKLSTPARSGDRLDVVAAQSYARLAAANAKVAGEKYRPTFDIFATYSMNGRGKFESQANEDARGSDYPTTVVGLRFNAPIGGSVSATRSGYAKEASAAEDLAKRKGFEQDQEWQDLNDKLGQAKERLTLSRSLETLQKQRMDYERDRQQRGRSTMYQVIMAEQDFANTQLNRIRTQAELLRVVAQMGTYGGNK